MLSKHKRCHLFHHTKNILNKYCQYCTGTLGQHKLARQRRALCFLVIYWFNLPPHLLVACAMSFLLSKPVAPAHSADSRQAEIGCPALVGDHHHPFIQPVLQTCNCKVLSRAMLRCAVHSLQISSKLVHGGHGKP